MALENITILLIDDDKECVDALADDLLKHNVKTMIAYDGGSALELVSEYLPDLIVLSMQLPEMQDFRLLKQAKGVHPILQVIMVTGHKNDSDEAAAYSMGAYSFLQKPINIQELIENFGMAFPEKIENAIVAASLAEGGAFLAAGEVLMEAEIAEEVMAKAEANS